MVIMPELTSTGDKVSGTGAEGVAVLPPSVRLSSLRTIGPVALDDVVNFDIKDGQLVKRSRLNTRLLGLVNNRDAEPNCVLLYDQSLDAPVVFAVSSDGTVAQQLVVPQDAVALMRKWPDKEDTNFEVIVSSGILDYDPRTPNTMTATITQKCKTDYGDRFREIEVKTVPAKETDKDVPFPQPKPVDQSTAAESVRSLQKFTGVDGSPILVITTVTYRKSPAAGDVKTQTPVSAGKEKGKPVQNITTTTTYIRAGLVYLKTITRGADGKVISETTINVSQGGISLGSGSTLQTGPGRVISGNLDIAGGDVVGGKNRVSAGSILNVGPGSNVRIGGDMFPGTTVQEYGTSHKFAYSLADFDLIQTVVNSEKPGHSLSYWFNPQTGVVLKMDQTITGNSLAKPENWDLAGARRIHGMVGVFSDVKEDQNELYAKGNIVMIDPADSTKTIFAEAEVTWSNQMVDGPAGISKNTGTQTKTATEIIEQIKVVFPDRDVAAMTFKDIGDADNWVALKIGGTISLGNSNDGDRLVVAVSRARKTS